MSKERNDIDQDKDQDSESQQQPGDDQEHAEVAEKDGKTEVRFSGESKRERRLREIREERQREIDTAVNPLKESLASTNRMLQEAMARLQAPQHAPQPQRAEVDDIDEAYMQVATKQEALLEKIKRGGYTPEQGDRFRSEYYKLDRERAAIAARPVASEAISKYRPPQGPSAHEQQLASDHPDVWFNEDAKGYAFNLAQTKMLELKAQNKYPTPGEVKRIQNEALSRAAEVWGFRRPSQPSPEGQRQRFAGMPSSGRKASGPSTRQLSREERDLAIAGKPAGMSDADAIVRFAKLMDESETV
jgi:hypothetical protein